MKQYLNETEDGRVYSDCSIEELLGEILRYNEPGSGDDARTHTFYAACAIGHKLFWSSKDPDSWA